MSPTPLGLMGKSEPFPFLAQRLSSRKRWPGSLLSVGVMAAAPRAPRQKHRKQRQSEWGARLTGHPRALPSDHATPEEPELVLALLFSNQSASGKE